MTKQQVAAFLFRALHGGQIDGRFVSDEGPYDNVLIDGQFDLEDIAERLLAALNAPEAK